MSEWTEADIGETKPCPEPRCAGGMLWSERLWDFTRECPTCHGYAFVGVDDTPIDELMEARQ